MSRRASPSLVGAFVLGALVLLVTALLVWGGGRFSGNRETLVLYFRSETTGLTVGAPVVLKGVQIGTVKSIQVAYDEKGGGFLVPVHVEIDQDKVDWPGALRTRLSDPETYRAAMDAGLRARLGLQSLLTGLLQVEIGFFPGTPALLTGRDPAYLELPTVPSELERFRDEVLAIPVSQLVERLGSALGGLDRLVNAPELKRTLEGLDRAAGELALGAAEARALIGRTGGSLDATLGEVRERVADLAPRLETLAASLGEAAGKVSGVAGRASAEIGPLAESLRGASDAARGALVSAGRAFERLAESAGPGSPLQGEALAALRSLRGAADSLKVLADQLERHPESLVRGKR